MFGCMVIRGGKILFVVYVGGMDDLGEVEEVGLGEIFEEKLNMSLGIEVGNLVVEDGYDNLIIEEVENLWLFGFRGNLVFFFGVIELEMDVVY